ncbi:MAG: DsbC family protein [Gammaproteobacteria bacterium]|nr:DsbC family protein [Gammaproteobacteria bacterium]
MSARSDEAIIRESLERAAPEIQVTGISPSPVEGVFEVRIQDNQTRLYVTGDGRHFVAGDLYAVLGTGVNNLSEEGRKAQRRAALGGIPAEDLIAFAPNQKLEVVLYVFTDVDCPYCRILHQDVARLGDYGVEVRYLAYPRSGPGTSTYDKMVSAWCSRSPSIAIAALFEDKKIDSVSCLSPVAAHFELAKSLGIGGTPTLFTEDGTEISGYYPVEELIAMLGLE